MFDLAKYALSVLRKNRNFTIYRGLQRGNPVPILVKVSVDASPDNTRRLENEFSLSGELDSAWAVRPLELTRHEGRVALILEDPKSAPLSEQLEIPLNTMNFLPIAISLAASVGQLHRRGLIHKDLKPATLLVDEGGKVRLTGFGVAGRLCHEIQMPLPPAIITGTFAYMAPEQAGRMNRLVDFRSDLYSLGVTMYQMLTGVLPFVASEPNEWIHCHVARIPPAPSTRIGGVPGPMDAIVLKLLAKNPADRYQSAAGLEADLQHCLKALGTCGCLLPFPLGAADTSDQLLIPDRLYGRTAEIDTLVAAFDRIATQGTTELVMVFGPAGCGKSSLVEQFNKLLPKRRGLFAAGKFNQYTRDIPYATVAQAFEGLVRELLCKTDTEIRRWRRSLLNALGPNGQLMIDLIPGLALIIGEQSPVFKLPPVEERARFQLLFRRFLGVFTQAEHPLALFLDDLQWSDAATLDLIEHLAVHADVKNLLLIGAYRDNEIVPSHPLLRTLEAIGLARRHVEKIRPRPLTPEDVGCLVADALHTTVQQAKSLARLVHDKTAGSPFFIVQFITMLAQERLITLDPHKLTWRWDTTHIQAKSFTDNVVDLMAAKLGRLTETTQKALGQLACCGDRATIPTLTAVLGTTEDEIGLLFSEVVRSGLLAYADAEYRFLHDRVREAAYMLVPESEKAATHLQIARTLAPQGATSGLDDKIFEIVNQFDRATGLIDLPRERGLVAALHLMAGKRAKAMTAYKSALAYLVGGCELLGKGCWELNYQLAFDLELNRAECEFLTGELSLADERLSVLSARAGNIADHALVARLRMALYTTLGRLSDAVDVGLDYLRDIGIRLPKHPADEDVQRELDRMWQLAGSRHIDEFVDLPAMTDPVSRAAMDVLAGMLSPTFLTERNLHDLALLAMATLSLEHGNCDASCYAYARISTVLGPRFGAYEAALRFGQVGCDLTDRHSMPQFKARVYECFGTFAAPWIKPLDVGRALIKQAIRTANADGDLTYEVFGSKNLVTNLMFSGEPLSNVRSTAEQGLEIARKAKFGFAIDGFVGQLLLIKALQGSADKNSIELCGLLERELEQKPHPALSECWYWIHRLQERFFAEDIEGALAADVKASRLLWSTRSVLEIAQYHFFAALSRAAACKSATNQDRLSEHRQAIDAHYHEIGVWAENCPETFGNCKSLVGAEIARLECRELQAERLYEEAIRAARASGFTQNEGLAHELAARFYFARDFGTIAEVYLRNARSCYSRWGADGKVSLLDRKYPQLSQEMLFPKYDITVAAPVEQLDAGTMLKASQALSGEILLNKLVETLMRIALEHAGAERGVLVLLRNGDRSVAAQAVISQGDIEVTLQDKIVTCRDLPEFALNYIIRTRETLILDDAAASSVSCDDTYVRDHDAKSVLCLPVIKQSELVGALYLENNLVMNAFTPRQVAILEFLASQAAISIENAYLYDGLLRSEAFLTEGQRLSGAGTWSWDIETGKVVWSEEHCRIFGYDPTDASKPTFQFFLDRVHPEDRTFLEQRLSVATNRGVGFAFDFRIVLPDGLVKYLHGAGRPLMTKSGKI